MKKLLFCALFVFSVMLMSWGHSAPQKRTVYCGIAFYNQENLFDTIHDEGKFDQDFLPDGSYHWNTMKYTHKLANMSKVLSELCTERVKGGAAFIGLSEVENSRVLEDLVNQPALKERGYRYIHIEGPDARGIDCAALYNPRMFRPAKWTLIPPTGYYQATGHGTRGFLLVEGNLLGEKVHFIVNHWPSRAAGSFSREVSLTRYRQLRQMQESSSWATSMMILTIRVSVKVWAHASTRSPWFLRRISTILGIKCYASRGKAHCSMTICGTFSTRLFLLPISWEMTVPLSSSLKVRYICQNTSLPLQAGTKVLPSELLPVVYGLTATLTISLLKSIWLRIS